MLCLEEIESDMSAVHRIEDMNAMPARKFFTFCKHLVAYKGALRMRAEKDHEDREKGRRFDSPKTDTRNWKKKSKSSGQAQEKDSYFKDPGLNPALAAKDPALAPGVPFLEKGDPTR